MRIALGVEYDGSAYAGWQFQTGQSTVQAALEQALSQIADQPIRIHCAGRTDAGVHALNQVVHFDTEASRDNQAWELGVNTLLPSDIRVRWAKLASDNFHARFSATARSYVYYLLSSRTQSALLRQRVYWLPQVVDVERMHQAAQYLLGEHDFSAFRSRDCQSQSPFRLVSNVCVEQTNSGLLRFSITANAFLHHMVRNIVGSLVEVGIGKQQVEWFHEALLSKNRACAGRMAPACGLYLAAVQYPDEFAIPSHASDVCASIL